MKNIYCNVMLWVSVMVLRAVISRLCKILFLILCMLLQASFILFLSLYENLWINIHFKFMELVSFYKYAKLPCISEKSKGKKKNIENRVGRGLWRLCSLYSASRVQLCFCHIGKHLSNSSLGAHSDRDFTITQGNLFPRLWFLKIKGFFWYPTWISVAVIWVYFFLSSFQGHEEEIIPLLFAAALSVLMDCYRVFLQASLL